MKAVKLLQKKNGALRQSSTGEAHDVIAFIFTELELSMIAKALQRENKPIPNALADRMNAEQYQHERLMHERHNRDHKAAQREISRS